MSRLTHLDGYIVLTACLALGVRAAQNLHLAEWTAELEAARLQARVRQQTQTVWSPFRNTQLTSQLKTTTSIQELYTCEGMEFNAYFKPVVISIGIQDYFHLDFRGRSTMANGDFRLTEISGDNLMEIKASQQVKFKSFQGLKMGQMKFKIFQALHGPCQLKTIST